MLRERLFIFGLIAATVEATGAPLPTPVAQIQPPTPPSAPTKPAPTPRRAGSTTRPATPAPLPSGVMSRQQLLVVAPDGTGYVSVEFAG